MKQKIKFTKMHGLGNDFVIVNNLNKNFLFTPKIISQLSHRNTGIGFDQLLVVERSKYSHLDFFYKIFNANGKEVYQCGNGARCFAHFVYLKKLTTKKNIYVYTKQSTLHINNIDKEEIIVNMGKPIFEPYKIPFLVPEYNKEYSITIEDKNIVCSVLSLGNPHCIVNTKNIFKTSVTFLGGLIERHFLFPEGVNVSFMQIKTTNEISLRVYERGVGETKACGSAACAAVIVGILQKKITMGRDIIVHLPGGVLKIFWENKKSCVYMKGPSTHVYDGIINI
ncbi:diaminopimelate epimerase [Buchnera aphidicola (Nipponaphis monzeni)]|uniref:Diaminopimelate epimerase n=1 Tax=Buchnera aphidicola (Nipponaphis monzeni) TaxID=2495405 RepID=A0A455TAW0_9GAMM|nr:diaminopimelate epimerase [Buchnera aphidicola]BBI01440.1 diaminopimelate epimerase [Buchnera aphidicola (Nipponaphis monzeni)]